MEPRTPGGFSYYEYHRRLSIAVDRYRGRARRDSGTRARRVRPRAGHVKDFEPDGDGLPLGKSGTVVDNFTDTDSERGGRYGDQDSLWHPHLGPGRVRLQP